jgi:hypothetical protein
MILTTSSALALSPVTRVVLQRCHKGVTRLLQGCHKGVTCAVWLLGVPFITGVVRPGRRCSLLLRVQLFVVIAASIKNTCAGLSLGVPFITRVVRPGRKLQGCYKGVTKTVTGAFSLGVPFITGVVRPGRKFSRDRNLVHVMLCHLGRKEERYGVIGMSRGVDRDST